MEHIFRIVDFNVYNDKEEEDKYVDGTTFMIQMFGLNKIGETCSIIAENYKPFFYVMVNESWTIAMKNSFLAHIKDKIGKYYQNFGIMIFLQFWTFPQ